MRSKKQNHLSVSREAVSTLKQTKLILGDLDLANAVNGCVHNESNAVFICLQIFRIRSKKQNHLPVFREAVSTVEQTKLGV
jgi:hypothetical protein